MIRPNSSNKHLYYLITATVYAMTLFRFCSLKIGTNMDDVIFKKCVFAFGSWRAWAQAMYKLHSGRVFIHTFTWMFLNLPLFIWDLVSSALVVLTLVLCEKCVGIKRDVCDSLLFVAATILFYLIPGQDAKVFGGVSFALNYLYPVCALLVVHNIFYMMIEGRHMPVWVFFLAVPSVLLCSNMEQSGAIMLAMGPVYVCYALLFKKTIKKENRLYMLGIWLLNLVGFLGNYAAPGNRVRYVNEMMKASGYRMYSLVERLMLGVQAIFVDFFHFRGLIIWLMPTALYFLIGMVKRNRFILVASVINAVLSCLQYIYIKYMMDANFLYPYDIRYSVWFIASCLLLLINGIIIYESMTSFEDQFLYSFIYLAALASSIVVCFSPTLFVSAIRTTYISYVLLIMIVVKIIDNLLILRDEIVDEDTEFRQCSGRFRIGYCCIWILASIMLLILYIRGYRSIDTYSVSELTKTKQYVLKDVQINTNGVLTAELDVCAFEYTPKWWSTDKIELDESMMEEVAQSGYDIKAQIGVLDEKSGIIKGYKTCLESVYPTMIQYPDNCVRVKAFIAPEDIEGQTLVLLAENHEGDRYYQYIT